jgi:hypothetical protein
MTQYGVVKFFRASCPRAAEAPEVPTWDALESVPKPGTLTEYCPATPELRPICKNPFAQMIPVPLVLFRHRFHADRVVLGFSEAGRRDSFVLIVGESYSLPGHPSQSLRHSFIANTEREALRSNARLRKHSELALPCLADPAFVGKLLKLTAALAG